MKELTPSSTPEQVCEKLLSGYQDALLREGIHERYLAKKLKRELNAKEIKIFKSAEDKLIHSKNLIAWKIRQAARMDAQKLLGFYPAEKLDHTHRFDEPLIDIVRKLRNEKK